MVYPASVNDLVLGRDDLCDLVASACVLNEPSGSFDLLH